MTSFSCRIGRLRLREGENEMTFSSSRRQGQRGVFLVQWKVMGEGKQGRERQGNRRECCGEI